MFTEEEGEAAVRIAREVIEKHVKGESPEEPEMPDKFEELGGVFVTLKKYPSGDLRGCIGYPEPVFKLKRALPQAAVSATQDPRFHALAPKELDEITVEVTLLTPPKDIEFKDPFELPEKIECGKDGLIISKGPFSGLLLPQVPVEHGWNEEQFLDHTCLKAGLTPDAWRKGECSVKCFRGYIFAENEPCGKVEKKEIG